ncbi:MAG: DNA polymerase IV [Spirochaetaceae bacterium]|nr:MAG: DNA polymerase IV [Spirochaetaceae bacterium]
MVDADRLEPIFFHVDLDAFFASVEQHDDPSLKGRPVIVGASPEGGRGVVSACSYEARRFGVHSAMPISEAYRRCPKGVFLPVRMQRYRELSARVMGILEQATPVFRRISIDEAGLEMTGTERVLGPAYDVAADLKKKITTTTGLITSIGIGPNRFIAKLASEHKKPDGLYRVKPGEEEEFVAALQLNNLWGIGKKTRARLETLGIDTVLKLRSNSLEKLRGLFGQAAGEYLYQVARGIDPGVYRARTQRHSISAETTFLHDTADPTTIRRTVLALSHEVFFRLLDESAIAHTVQLKYRYSDFSTHTARRTLKHPIASSEELNQVIVDLLTTRTELGRAIRLLGVALEDVVSDDQPRQNELFEDPDERKRRVESAVHSIKKKYGDDGIKKAGFVSRTRTNAPKPDSR